jgi:hypothetical protein
MKPSSASGSLTRRIVVMIGRPSPLASMLTNVFGTTRARTQVNGVVVDPWVSFVNPRAYTAAPMAPAVGVFHAAAWVFSHSTEVSWASLGIVVPDSSLLPEIEQLRRLKSRGVRMGTITQAENARHFDRVLLAYRPDAATLARAEALEDARVVIAIGDAPDALRDWVAEHQPVHLGGAKLTPAVGAPLLSTAAVIAS